MKHAKGIEQVPVFVAGMKPVLSCNPIHEFDLIIGMDIIAKGDFAITGKDGNTKFSFRMPSIADIDFACPPTSSPNS